MKKLIIKDNIHGRTATVNAQTTSQTKSGKWVAEVDSKEYDNACIDLCRDIQDCNCKDLHVEADQDDDGKEYNILTSE